MNHAASHYRYPGPYVCVGVRSTYERDDMIASIDRGLTRSSCKTSILLLYGFPFPLLTCNRDSLSNRNYQSRRNLTEVVLAAKCRLDRMEDHSVV